MTGTDLIKCIAALADKGSYIPDLTYGARPVLAVGAAIAVFILIALINRHEDRNAEEEEESEGTVCDNGDGSPCHIRDVTERTVPLSHSRPIDCVIAVRDVSMSFKVATTNASGLKDFLIQSFTRRMTYRRLKALDHVSFSVGRGEVVGIIGTNGSGKSTLLKILSGVLKPTGGEVAVDTSKIQLLTLGTGFDVELTGRENVYLNGAIIGYTKEFLDTHYEDIVEFAELSGFMEEKVKNYSSGMQSRLAFAIATAGKASEILILDEVLSVGDDFFRKKSLARVKELIHSGATALVVSHDMDTIREHTTRAIWIEKGVLMMDGEPDAVCDAYLNNGEKH